MKVTSCGIRDGHDVSITHEMLDKYHSASDLTAMQRCTAFPATSVVRAILDGSIKERGAMTQEHFVDTKRVLREIGERGIEIIITEKYGGEH